MTVAASHSQRSSQSDTGSANHIVKLHDGIKLVPLADDPLATLRDEFADVEKSADELRDEARDVALDEAGR